MNYVTGARHKSAQEIRLATTKTFASLSEYEITTGCGNKIQSFTQAETICLSYELGRSSRGMDNFFSGVHRSAARRLIVFREYEDVKASKKKFFARNFIKLVFGSAEIQTKLFML